MSTWTSRKATPFLSLVAAGLVLAACFENAALGRLTDRGSDAPAGPEAIAVLDGGVVVIGPTGYCVDPGATRESNTEAFVLMVRCVATSRAAPVLSATVTGIAAPAGDDPRMLDRLGAFLASEAGRTQLSRTGRAEELRIDEILVENGAIWLRLHDIGNPETFDPAYWRAILPLAERVVTLSVLSARANPVGRDRGLMVLQGFVARMRQQNAR